MSVSVYMIDFYICDLSKMEIFHSKNGILGKSTVIRREMYGEVNAMYK